MQQAGALELVELGHDAVARKVRRHQPHVVERLGPDAAEPDQHDRSPVGIAPRADDQLDAGRRHRLDQHAVEREARLPCNAVRAPRGLERGCVGDIQRDAARVALVGERGGLRLQRDRIADARRDLFRLASMSRASAPSGTAMPSAAR